MAHAIPRSVWMLEHKSATGWLPVPYHGCPNREMARRSASEHRRFGIYKAVRVVKYTPAG